jgi:hypothetical protein
VIDPSQRPLLDKTQHSKEEDIHDPAEFEPGNPESERPQTHALERAASGKDDKFNYD